MKRLTSLVAVGILTVVATAGLLASNTTQTTAKAAVHHPCPSGMVCVYKGTKTTSRIIHGFYVLGPASYHPDRHKHLVVNRLWDKRRFTLKNKHNGKGHKVAVIRAGRRKVIDFTHVRSVILEKPCPVKKCFTNVPL